jgi:hypothetical protein
MALLATLVALTRRRTNRMATLTTSTRNRKSVRRRRKRRKRSMETRKTPRMIVKSLAGSRKANTLALGDSTVSNMATTTGVLRSVQVTVVVTAQELVMVALPTGLSLDTRVVAEMRMSMVVATVQELVIASPPTGLSLGTQPVAEMKANMVAVVKLADMETRTIKKARVDIGQTLATNKRAKAVTAVAMVGKRLVVMAAEIPMEGPVAMSTVVILMEAVPMLVAEVVDKAVTVMTRAMEVPVAMAMTVDRCLVDSATTTTRGSDADMTTDKPTSLRTSYQQFSKRQDRRPKVRAIRDTYRMTRTVAFSPLQQRKT